VELYISTMVGKSCAVASRTGILGAFAG
jgi:hypothetical protein